MHRSSNQQKINNPSHYCQICSLKCNLIFVAILMVIPIIFFFYYFNKISEHTSSDSFMFAFLTLGYCYYLYYFLTHTFRKALSNIKDIKDYEKINKKLIQEQIIKKKVKVIQHNLSKDIPWSIIKVHQQDIYPTVCIDKTPTINEFLRNKHFIIIYYKIKMINNSKTNKIYYKIDQIVNQNKGQFLHDYSFQDYIDFDQQICYSLCKWRGRWLRVLYDVCVITGLLMPYLWIVQKFLISQYKITIVKQYSYDQAQQILSSQGTLLKLKPQ